jgi:sialic acid synthase SpsE/sugar phosphate isomerase/epimerase
MITSKKISEFMVFEYETILRALEKINNNKRRIIFVVDDNGCLVGSFNDGDFRRWLTSNLDFDFNTQVSEAMNDTFTYEKTSTSPEKICEKFSNDIDLIPLVDDFNRFDAIALNDYSGFIIGSQMVSENSPCFVIAEVGNNHNGDIKLAKKLVDLALESGADCVKFQMRNMKSLYKGGSSFDNSADLGSQYTMDLLNKFQLSNEQLFDVFDYCKIKNLTPLCTPWDEESLNALEEYGMEFYKVASADLTNHRLLEAMADTKKPLICSTGMSIESEIIKTTNFLRKKAVNFCFLHCNSTYPTPFKDINLNYLSRLKKLSGQIVGYSGHERGWSVPVAAVALGARVVEKHFTIDKTMEGNDHKVSLLPEEFKQMVKDIRDVEAALGTSDTRTLTQGEMLNREVLAKSIIVNRRILKGDRISHEVLDIKSPGQGLQPIYMNELVGKISKRDMDKGDFFYESDLLPDDIQSRDYKFKRPFGIPVRYHDYKKLTEKSNLDFVEFHLSYHDMEIDLSDFFHKKESLDFAIHSPELFRGDHIMNLASDDIHYRKRSIDELNRVCKIARELKKIFPKTNKPVIVINAGGFSENGFLPQEKIPEMYKTVAESLYEIDQAGVEIIIQTMPPFPWHFGGQSYHNLFINPDEIHEFCMKYKYRICYDVSHSMMACNYFKWDLGEFTKKIGKFIAHMHVVDALGVDGEGVQIGRGDVNFNSLGQDLETYAPNSMFIPEVWQGHKNSGEGFWHALDFLEQFF